jgi:sugar O-acyltransferase (sialic acid O-acetyltransferase NeuD family)
VIGGGEHALVVADAARAAGWIIEGLVDPRPAERTLSLLGVAHLGDDAAFASRLMGMSEASAPFLILGIGAIGKPEVREAVVARFEHARWATIVHPAAWASPLAAIEEGSVVLAGAVVGPAARIGRHAVVNSSAVVEHDVDIGAHAQVAPGAVIGGGARLGKGAFVGLGALVRDHISIGAGAFVAMGSVVVEDVPPGITVSGLPARPRETAPRT